MGRTLSKPLKGLLEWSFANAAAMAEARRAYRTGQQLSGSSDPRPSVGRRPSNSAI
jgi:hypothetical protein